jgi:ABC-type sugar transport system ATPase subunit
VSVAFRARGLEARFGRFVLGPVDLDVQRGEYLVLVGPSGSGKTILLETLIGWHEPAAGEVLLGNRPVASIAPAGRGIAYVPQDLGLFPHLDVRENLLVWQTCRREPADPVLLQTVLDSLGLEPLLDRRDPLTLSHGEQQRVALGRALLTRPERLVLDEPCAALDSHLRREFQLLLRRIHAELGTTVLHVTHDREEALLLGQRIAVLLGGRIRQLAAPRDLYMRPTDAAVARFLAQHLGLSLLSSSPAER